MNECVLDSDSAAATDALGRRLGELLFPGSVIALFGPMGAGKTHITRAIAAGMGAEERAVSSPTFALVHEYAGRVPIYHFDTYRLPDVAAWVKLGTAEYLQGDGVCIIEWADRVATALPNEYLRVTIEPAGEERRLIRIESIGERHAGIVRALTEP